MDYSKIPDELKELKQWVCCWNNSKTPMRAYERRASSVSNSETWSDFETAVKAVENRIYDCIGFVFSGNGYIGIDLDTGFSDGFLTKECALTIKACQSYTEKSRSGRGVHILLKGSLPFSGANNRNGAEIYQSGRYFIMTGKQILFKNIIENQDAVDTFLNTYFSTAEHAQSGSKRLVDKIYTPLYKPPERGCIKLRPEYETIGQGCRNISLTSLAGQMWSTGYSIREIYRELCYVNQCVCDPKLPPYELETICRSILKYKR